jgi:putative transposase
MCRVVDVSCSGYYAWHERTPSAREMANQGLIKNIESVYIDHRRTYGSPRVYHELRAEGIACSENRVARVMRLHKLRGRPARQHRGTTKPDKANPVAPNLLEMDFTAVGPDRKWLSDITYIRTQEAWLYPALVLDLRSCGIVGWAMSERMTTDFTLSALKQALQRRQPEAGLILDSDRGSQCTDRIYQTLLQAHGIRASMNGVGSWYDNAPMESFIATLKTELIYQCRYQTCDEARADLFSYIEVFYNRQRRRSSLGYLSPEAYEQLSYQQCEFRLSVSPPGRGKTSSSASSISEMSRYSVLKTHSWASINAKTSS